MRLIDVDKIVFYTPRWCDDEGLFVKWLKETLKNAPTVDAVPVVRCKDCKHWARNDGMFKDFDEREWHHCPHLGIDTDGYFACIEGKKNDRDK